MNFRIFSRTNMIILILLSNEEITIKAGIPSDSVGVYINEGPKKSERYESYHMMKKEVKFQSPSSDKFRAILVC